jgi:hypothetical protein
MDFALQSEEKFPLDTISDVVKAQNYFRDYEYEIPIKHRREYCCNVYKKLREFGLDPNDKVAVYASNSLDPMKLATTITSRKLLLEDLELEKGASEKEKAFKELETIVKTASNVDDLINSLINFDTNLGLSKFWDTTLPNPILGVVAIEKLGSEVPGLIEIGAARATEDQLRKLARHWMYMKDVFSKEFIEAFKTEGPSAMSMLTGYEKEVLLNMAHSLDAVDGYYE